MTGNPQTGPDATVTQGPEWLAHFLLTPPPWVNAALQVLGLVVLCLVVWRLHQQDWHVDAETQLQMGRIAGTITGVITCVLAMANLTSQPYAVDVAVGAIVGWGVVAVGLSSTVLGRVSDWCDDARSRRGTAWLWLAVIVLLAPELVAVAGRGNVMFTGRLAVSCVSVGMAALNFRSVPTAS